MTITPAIEEEPEPSTWTSRSLAPISMLKYLMRSTVNNEINKNEALVESEAGLYFKQVYGIDKNRITNGGEIVLHSEEIGRHMYAYIFETNRDNGNLRFLPTQSINYPVITFKYIHDPLKTAEVIRHWEL